MESPGHRRIQLNLIKLSKFPINQVALSNNMFQATILEDPFEKSVGFLPSLNQTSNQSHSQFKMNTLDVFANVPEQTQNLFQSLQPRSQKLVKEKGKNFKETHEGWMKIEKNLKSKTRRNYSLCFEAVKTIYVHSNPEKIDLINDNIPQYWEHSLRNNNKRLKSHLAGVEDNQKIVNQMLFTLKGTKQIQSQIPTCHLQNTQLNLKLKGNNKQRTKDSDFPSKIQIGQNIFRSDANSIKKYHFDKIKHIKNFC